MSKFLTGKPLEEKLTDIIWNAKKYVVIISPFIRLDSHVRSIFDKIKATHEIHLILIFGKNEGYKQKSLREDDFEYFKNFKNISILYNKNLHAKHYSNEKEGLITSLNLYDYSMINNIEYGVHFSKSILNPTEKLFEETEDFTDELIFEKSHVVFLKKPQYKKKLLGLTKSYQNSTVLFDISSEFFNGYNYEIKSLSEFDYENLNDVDKVYDKKPERQNKIELEPEFGFCIRTGEQIPYNPQKPFSYYAFKTWQQFENYNYAENYCHKTGKESYGKTSMNNPILKQ
ncbi:phospholipase D family protein [uncultured Tenacibaculum sp.]|uniref:phospholipase D family protein n=1 Tax=uncultured Tenacibaculum sp. TaxID=174713 RepID=UPI002604B746|nr:phospholipase D family protein [uncultured Tenacibaculum sp.]